MKDDITGRLKEMLAVGDYAITESDSIPGPGDNRLTFGNTGVQFWASTLYIDMRGIGGEAALAELPKETVLGGPLRLQ